MKKKCKYKNEINVIFGEDQSYPIFLGIRD